MPWLEALASERRCVVVVARLGVDSNVLGSGCGPALDLLANRGLVAAATVQTASVLGLHTALAVKARRVPGTRASFAMSSAGQA